MQSLTGSAVAGVGDSLSHPAGVSLKSAVMAYGQ